MMIVRRYLAPSSIEGLGVLARWYIPAGTEMTCDYAVSTIGEIVMQPSRHAVGPQPAMA